MISSPTAAGNRYHRLGLAVRDRAWGRASDKAADGGG